MPAAKFVLLLMDYQECICRPEQSTGLSKEVEGRDVIGRASRTLEHFRSNAWPIVHVRVALDSRGARLTSAAPRFRELDERGLFRSDAPSTAIVAELTPLDAELVIEKGAVNPFIGTPLHAQLTNRGVVHLVLGGVATNHVVEGTARYAADCGYEVTVLEDLCASATAALHDFSVKEILPAYGTVTSSVDALGRLHGTDDRPGSHDD